MPRLSLKLLSPAALLLAASFLPACSQSAQRFDSEWHAKTTPIVADAATTIAGKWEGTWQSNSYDYYNGMCRAIITPESTAKNLPTDPPGARYRVDICEYYANLIPKNYSFAVFVTPGYNGKASITGEKNFGPLNDGLYKFEGDATGRALFLSFTSAKDYGTITLRRWPPAKP